MKIFNFLSLENTSHFLLGRCITVQIFTCWTILSVQLMPELEDIYSMSKYLDFFHAFENIHTYIHFIEASLKRAFQLQCYKNWQYIYKNIHKLYNAKYNNIKCIMLNVIM